MATVEPIRDLISLKKIEKILSKQSPRKGRNSYIKKNFWISSLSKE